MGRKRPRSWWRGRPRPRTFPRENSGDDQRDSWLLEPHPRTGYREQDSPVRPFGEPFMPYTAEISRLNPTLFVFLVDRSTSMAKPFGGQPGKSKAEGVADAINRLLQNLVLKCARADGVRDYFHVAVIGYGAELGPALGG